MSELGALVRREWAQSARWTLGITALTVAGYAFLFALCSPPDRYRLLCDPPLLRRVALTAPALIGAALAFRSFAAEVRQGTWDGLMLLPIARGKVVLAKALFAFSAVALVSIAPMYALWALLSTLSANGGPLLTARELLSESVIPRALVTGAAAFVGGASASLLLRGAKPLAWAAGVAPVLLFVSHHGERLGDLPSRQALWLGAALAVLGLSHVAREVRETGARASTLLLSLRAAVVSPLPWLVLLFMATTAADVQLRHETRGLERDDTPRWGVSDDGHIRMLRRDESSLAFAHLSARGHSVDPPTRYWQPVALGERLQFFADKRSPVLLAFDWTSGRAAGCAGRDGFRASGCAAFDSVLAFVPNLQQPFVLTARGVHAVDEERRTVHALYRGAVDRVVYLGSDEATIALQSGDDLVFIGRAAPPDPPSDETEDAADAPAAPVVEARGAELVATVACRGAGAFGAIEELSVSDDFIALEVGRIARRERTIVVCRDGAIAERRTLARPPRWGSEPTLRDRLLALALGPAALYASSPRHTADADGEPTMAPRRPTRATWTAATITALLCSLALALHPRRSSSGALTAALLGFATGPAYALALLWTLWAQRKIER
jgi:ABC-type transport system involved in cytochrome c biogenesis permease component